MDRNLGAQLPHGVSGVPGRVTLDRIPNCSQLCQRVQRKGVRETKMFGSEGNFGRRCRETITLNIAVSKTEEVIF